MERPRRVAADQDGRVSLMAAAASRWRARVGWLGRYSILGLKGRDTSPLVMEGRPPSALACPASGAAPRTSRRGTRYSRCSCPGHRSLVTDQSLASEKGVSSMPDFKRWADAAGSRLPGAQRALLGAPALQLGGLAANAGLRLACEARDARVVLRASRELGSCASPVMPGEAPKDIPSPNWLIPSDEPLGMMKSAGELPAGERKSMKGLWSEG